MQINENKSSPKVIGLGSLGLDYLATVSHFPEPDEKTRTEELQVSKPHLRYEILSAISAHCWQL
jgi:hypothetical protein